MQRNKSFRKSNLTVHKYTTYLSLQTSRPIKLKYYSDIHNFLSLPLLPLPRNYKTRIKLLPTRYIDISQHNRSNRKRLIPKNLPIHFSLHPPLKKCSIKNPNEREREREKTIPPTGHVSPVSRRDIVRTRYARMRATIILSTLKISIINPAFLSSLPLSPSLWSSQQNSQGITFRTRHASLSLPATSGAETGYNYKRSPKRV